MYQVVPRTPQGNRIKLLNQTVTKTYEILNDSDVSVTVSLKDPEDPRVAVSSNPLTIGAKSKASFSVDATCLQKPDKTYRYNETVSIPIYQGESLVDTAAVDMICGSREDLVAVEKNITANHDGSCEYSVGYSNGILIEENFNSCRPVNTTPGVVANILIALLEKNNAIGLSLFKNDFGQIYVDYKIDTLKSSGLEVKKTKDIYYETFKQTVEVCTEFLSKNGEHVECSYYYYLRYGVDLYKN